MKKQSFLFVKSNINPHVIILAIGICLALLSCSNKEQSIDGNAYSKLLQVTNSSHTSTHRWFYFTEDGFKETDIPRNAPDIEKKPWTEAIRITSSAFIDNTAYLSVNKLGILICPETFGYQKNGIASETKLIKNSELFATATVGNLFCIDGTPVFNLYTNSIFDADKQDDWQTQQDYPFLIQLLPSTYEFIPLLSQESLKNWGNFEDINIEYPKNAEIRELHLDGENWNVLFKSNSPQQTEFSALSFSATEPITSFRIPSPPNATASVTTQKNLAINDISIDTYRELTRPQQTSALPRLIAELLEPIPPHVSYYLDHIENSGTTITQYVHQTAKTAPLQGYSLALEHCSIAVFEDGTTCFAGALPLKGVINDGKTVAFKLPNLGAGYMYGAMALSGSTLFIAWEETSFFETGRCGFLTVDLEQILYP